MATCCHVFWTIVPPIVNGIALWNPTNAVPFVPSASASVETKFVPPIQCTQSAIVYLGVAGMYATLSFDDWRKPVKYGALTNETFGAIVSLKPRTRLYTPRL